MLRTLGVLLVMVGLAAGDSDKPLVAFGMVVIGMLIARIGGFADGKKDTRH